MKGKISMEVGSTSVSDTTKDVDLFETFATHAETPKGVTAEHLSKVWRISHEDAAKTLNVTTQLNKRSIDASLSHRFSTNNRMLRYKRIDSLFYTDTFFS